MNKTKAGVSYTKLTTQSLILYFARDFSMVSLQNMLTKISEFNEAFLIWSESHAQVFTFFALISSQVVPKSPNLS